MPFVSILMERYLRKMNHTKLPSLFLWIRLCGLLYLHRIIYHQVHEFIKTLERSFVSIVHW